ncbi:LysR substrate-binding domain-containing protein [Marilutibacter chinensis]|uniref:LysR substrate-binding domain-containing protein n=1 Tax=Marilutibacter chinensis TaxID=2912247 RepID=A0ABS9HQJ7_9GAMM|nr:LysR substrate-binding domain-containing protein [Lysobacter chinensis]MCF7221211.1 LysR substrate-binding domain-containing protein [Lysobacter chinensis]MCF7223048.1 LysR substrate-binding domain-containing protein [Lysobacter chinensis]
MALRADLLPALAAFESAARHQNFTHAAEELHLTASAVSHHVRKLEARLGVTLFQRHARGVSLTAEGRQLADAAGSALADVDGVVRGLRASRDEHARVRVTTLHSLAYTWLIPRMHALQTVHPDIHLSLDTEVALTRFDDGGPDLGIRHGPGHWPGLTAHLLMDETLFPVAAPDFPGLDGIAGAADIAQLPLIADHARQGWLDWFRAADVHGVRIEERHTFSDTTDALNAAAFGHGAALARERIAAPYLEARRLVRLPGPVLQARWSYYVVYPAHRRLRPAARRFVDWLLALPKD